MALTVGIHGRQTVSLFDDAGATSDRHRYHQQYLADTKNPYGYCPDHGTGVSCPVGVVKASGPAESISVEG